MRKRSERKSELRKQIKIKRRPLSRVLRKNGSPCHSCPQLYSIRPYPKHGEAVVGVLIAVAEKLGKAEVDLCLRLLTGRRNPPLALRAAL